MSWAGTGPRRRCNCFIRRARPSLELPLVVESPSRRSTALRTATRLPTAAGHDARGFVEPFVLRAVPAGENAIDSPSLGDEQLMGVRGDFVERRKRGESGREGAVSRAVKMPSLIVSGG